LADLSVAQTLPQTLRGPRTHNSLNAEGYFHAFKVTGKGCKLTPPPTLSNEFEALQRETSFYVHQIIVGMVTGKKPENANLSVCFL